MRFFLGTHMPSWLWNGTFTDIPLFVSRRRLAGRKTLKPATTDWALDSGGFSELSMYGQWRTHAWDYACEAKRYQDEIGRLQWAAPQDWMCEPVIRAKTGSSVLLHQEATIGSLLYLRMAAPEVPWAPVLQGWEYDDYLRCVDRYANVGIDLTKEPIVGLGSVCRRQDTIFAERLVKDLGGTLNLHGFGMKVGGLERSHPYLASADSLAWSFRARKLRGTRRCCSAASCANCPVFAREWYRNVVSYLSHAVQLAL